MKQKHFMKRAQSRGHSRFARVLTMLAMLFTTATGAWAQTWTNIVKNSNMEGTDVSCFYVQEKSKDGTFLARITDGIGVNGSRAIKVQTTGEESAGYETQFDIRLPYELPAGTQYRLSFDYKSDKAAVRVSNDEDYSFGFQVSNEPGQYVWWTLGGWPAPSIETTEDNVNKWQHYEAEYTVPADCNGSQSGDGDWLLNFQTIYICLATNKVATEFIIDNVKVEIDATVLAGLTEQPVTDPMLMIPYYDDDAVAVGKLKAAIDTYDDIESPTADDKNTLQAAIDQFKADNADQEKDETAKVNTAGWKKFDGSNADLAPDWAAPAVTTYDKRSTQPAEVYEGSADGVNRTGIIIYQDITGLANGQYKVGFYGTAYYTNGRGFESTMEDGSTDVAYVFANEQKKFITARVGTSFSEYNLLQFNVTVTDGNIKLGLGKEKGGSNWHTTQIYQLTWFATAKEAYASYQTELAALVTEAEALAADERKTEGKDAFLVVLAIAEEAIGDKANWYNNTEIEAIITGLKKAMADFKQANYTTFDGTYYVQNVATGKFVTAGHDYGTRGIVDGTGLDLTLAANEDKTVVFDTQVFNGDDKHFLGSNLYMDSPSFGWIIEKAGEDVYTISNGTQFLGVDNEDNLVLQNEAANWKFVTKEERIAALDAATEENGMDATFLIQGANFSRGDGRVAAAWSVSDDCTNKNLSGGAQTNMCAESYCSPFTIQQTITGAPAGKYQLTAQGFYRQDENKEETVPAPYFFANGVNQDVSLLTGSENSMSDASASFTAGLYTIDSPIEFTVGDDGVMNIGISSSTNSHWVIWDNFRLTYLGVPATTYNVTFADGLTDWTSDPTSAAEGETIKLNYTGKKKVAQLAMTVSGAGGDEAKVVYALTEGDTFTSGQTVEVKDDAEAVVATITYGESGGADFKAAKADTHVTGYTAYTEGNGNNGNKAGGTFYTIVPVYDGTIDVAVMLNADKAFYIEEDGSALEGYNGIKVDAKYYGTYSFSVSAGKSYKVYCAGSKLGFFGFEYTYTLPVTIDVTPTENPNEWTFTMPASDVKVNVEYETALALSEADDNTAMLEEWDGYEADVTLTRTLQTGGWNTLAVPFSISTDNFTALQTLLAAQGGSMTLKQLSSTELNGNTLTLNFADATSIEAGKPYLVKVTKALNLATLPAMIDLLGAPVNPFKETEVSKTAVPTETDAVDFIPTLGKIQVTADKETLLFLGAGNELLNPSEDGQYIKGFRAYFQLKGEAVNSARSFVLNLGDGETTAISEELRVNSEEFAAAPVFDLQGRRVNNATKKGMYIMNGKKVVVR